MGQDQQQAQQNMTLGILAHVDAGKTTLSESILFQKGIIRSQGRVDHGNSFLDTDEMERQRGITIFSKQARFLLGNTMVTLLDTPGHVDFSAEMERSLQVLDYAILVISALDGVQSHTKTLWNLLETYQVPVFLFVNKMDQPVADRNRLMEDIKKGLASECFDYEQYELGNEEVLESIAVTDENVMESYLEHAEISKEELVQLIYRRKIVPCFFGSALKNEGVLPLCDHIGELFYKKELPTSFGARIFKIERDDAGNRVTHMKLTGGQLKVKEELCGADWESGQKINQIRLYQGDKYELCDTAVAGQVVAVTGLTYSRAGEGLGMEKWQVSPVLQPVLGYKLTWPSELSTRSVLEKMRILEEENPELKIAWEEEIEEIHVQLMGDVQIEVLHALVKQRFGFEVGFSEGDVLYKETICDVVEGVGHFEPLRHYAEAHLLLEPLPRGSGLVFEKNCREDELALNWQRLILTHLGERIHRGVLIGAPITDMKISVIAGRAHNKHTEGGDFRQASYRAVRQGLMQATSMLLEPYFSFRIDAPSQSVGRVLTDLERIGAKCEAPIVDVDTAIITGKAPVSTIRNYAKELTAYTKGLGRLSLVYAGYDVCHNPEEVMEKRGYDPMHDLRNTPDSVFCAHGSGFVVPWDEVFDYMHVESPLKKKSTDALEQFAARQQQMEEQRQKNQSKMQFGQEDEQLMAIFEKTYGPVKRRTVPESRKVSGSGLGEEQKENANVSLSKAKQKSAAKPKEKYLLVDGYNIIFAWEELKELAKDNIDGARGRLMDIMSEYQGLERCHLILVFDAYKVKGNLGVMQRYHNIDVVYTKEAETADQYIEKAAHSMKQKEYDITVATSDGLEQLIVWGQGCLVLSARQLKEEVTRARQSIRNEYLEKQFDRGMGTIENLTGLGK